jgi:hypothetical protein
VFVAEADVVGGGRGVEGDSSDAVDPVASDAPVG